MILLGSGGMFVQSSRFIKDHQGKVSDDVYLWFRKSCYNFKTCKNEYGGSWTYC